MNRMPNVFHGALAGVIVLCLTGCDASLSGEIKKYGFLRVQPPRQTLIPGSLIVIEPLPGGIVSVSPVCWRNQAFGNLPEPQTNQSMQTELKAQVEREFKLEADYVKKNSSNAEIRARQPDRAVDHPCHGS